ncbi:MAG: hypothetical protein ABIJ49_14310 [Pseudomonadota bacterium]
MARYAGSSGLVYMSTTAATAAISVGSLSEWSIDRAADRYEVTSFGDTQKTYVQGFSDTAVTFSGFWNDADETLFTAAIGNEAIRIYLYPSSNAISKYWYGTGYVDASMSVSVGGPVTVSGSAQAAGAWGKY